MNTNNNGALFVKSADGRMCMISGRRFKKLRSEILAGRGGVEVTALVAAGYEGFLDNSGEISDFEALNAYFGEVTK